LRSFFNENRPEVLIRNEGGGEGGGGEWEEMG
jgi:hypothetical protein